MKKLPLVTIVMPVHNGGKFVAQAMDSVLGQTYPNWELIIVDDASTDATKQILTDYATIYSQVRVFKHEKNEGIAKSLNDGISQAKGKYIARMDSDDVMKSNRLAVQVAYMMVHPGVVVSGTDMEEIDDNGKLIGKRQVPESDDQIREMMWYAMGLQHPTMMFSLKLIPSIFGWYQEMRYVEDLDLIFRLMSYGKLANVKECLYEYRIHDRNESLHNVRATYLSALRVRWQALLRYGYRPNLKSTVLQIASLVVLIIPPRLVWWLYKKMRSWR